jgi:hypothetical protein
MASIISAGTTSSTALNISGDTSGNLAFQTVAGANTITVPNSTGTIALTSQVIGVSQTMTDVKASRALGTTYTNSTGKPITVYVTISNTVGSAVGIYVIDSVTFWGTSIPSANAYYSMTMIVPNGSTYSATMNGTPTLQYWAEIR